MLGWAFKKNTNDTRESAAIYIANNIINSGISIDIYDPKVSGFQINSDLLDMNDKYDLNKINVFSDEEIEYEKYNIILITTEWDEFINYEWHKIYNTIKKPAYIFDGRNILDMNLMKKLGFNYIGVGRK